MANKILGARGWCIFFNNDVVDVVDDEGLISLVFLRLWRVEKRQAEAQSSITSG